MDRGETVFSIARLYDVSAQAIVTGNCLTNPNNIQAGQELRVPETGFSQADAAIENCNTEDAQIAAPRAGQALDGFVDIVGVAKGTDFTRYIVDWRPDDPAVDYRSFEEVFQSVPENGRLGRFNTDAFPPGLYWFRLRVLDSRDFIIGECAIRVRFRA